MNTKTRVIFALIICLTAFAVSISAATRPPATVSDKRVLEIADPVAGGDHTSLLAGSAGTGNIGEEKTQDEGLCTAVCPLPASLD